MSSSKNSHAVWDELVRRYFEAETTDEEEMRLRRFLVSEEGRDTRYDEVRAVMGYLACGRAQGASGALRSKAAAHEVPSVPCRHRRPSVWFRAGAVAAVLALVALPVAWRLAAAGPNVCVAYVGGHEVTAPDAVMEQMFRSFEEVELAGGAVSVENQLNEMFDTLEE